MFSCLDSTTGRQTNRRTDGVIGECKSHSVTGERDKSHLWAQCSAGGSESFRGTSTRQEGGGMGHKVTEDHRERGGGDDGEVEK